MQETTDRNGPGRPRDPRVRARDELVYQLIAAGTGSRAALAAAVGVDRPAVALSVQRLKRDGRIRKCPGPAAIVWVVADGSPCP